MCNETDIQMHFVFIHKRTLFFVASSDGVGPKTGSAAQTNKSIRFVSKPIEVTREKLVDNEDLTAVNEYVEMVWSNVLINSNNLYLLVNRYLSLGYCQVNLI